MAPWAGRLPGYALGPPVQECDRDALAVPRAWSLPCQVRVGRDGARGPARGQEGAVGDLRAASARARAR
eukprot:5652890-Pyramimonas_sp.AAC.1